MFRKRRSLRLALLAFGSALSLCTLALPGRASQTLSTFLGIGSNASGPNWQVCNSTSGTVESIAEGYDANWAFVCGATDSDGSTHSTSCSNAAYNHVILAYGWCDANGCYAVDQSDNWQSWPNTASAGSTLNAHQPGKSCRNVGFTATATAKN